MIGGVVSRDGREVRFRRAQEAFAAQVAATPAHFGPQPGSVV